MGRESIRVLLGAGEGQAARLRGLLHGAGPPGFRVEHAVALPDFLGRLGDASADVAVLDLALLEGEPGTAPAVREKAREVPLVAIAGRPEEGGSRVARDVGAHECLFFDELSRPLLSRALTYAVERHCLRQELSDARSPRPRVNGLRVLLVHPPGPVRELLVEALSEWEIPVSLAARPEDARRRAREARGAGEAVGLLLVGLEEAWGDPRDVATQFRGESVFHGATVGFLLPSTPSEDLRVPCGEPWVAGCLEAPFTRSRLLRFLEQLAGVDPCAEPRASRAAPSDAALRVLLVEDNEVNRLLAAALLGRRGWTVREAATGREALAALEAEEFDVVLMDVQMPDLDGLEATRILRERERTRGGHVPVVGLTAHAMKGDRELCLAAGMDGYVAKPVEAAELYDAVEESLSRGVPRPKGAPAAVDLTPLLAGLRNSWGTVGKLVRSFETTGPQTLASLRAALEEADRAALEFAAHKLRGSANIFGAKRLCELAARAEDLGRAGSLGPAASVVEEIERETARVLAALAAQAPGG